MFLQSKTHSFLQQATSTRIHRLIALYLHSYHHLRSPLLCSHPHFVPMTSPHLSSKNVDPKTEFHSPYWSPISDQAKSFIRRLAALDPHLRPTAQEALRDPWLTPTTDTPSHVDLSPTLRQNWSPRAKWHNALTGIRAANRFSHFGAAAAAAGSRTSTQSSGGWDDQDSSPGVASAPSKEEVVVEEVEVEESEMMPGSFEPAHREPSLPWTEVVGKNLDDFLTLLRVK